jgi:hypothetical protein
MEALEAVLQQLGQAEAMVELETLQVFRRAKAIMVVTPLTPDQPVVMAVVGVLLLRQRMQQLALRCLQPVELELLPRILALP